MNMEIEPFVLIKEDEVLNDNEIRTWTPEKWGIVIYCNVKWNDSYYLFLGSRWGFFREWFMIQTIKMV